MARAAGDNGTAEQAIDWAIDHNPDGGIEAEAFLRHWREGDLEEWPEFYEWLDQQEQPKLKFASVVNRKGAQHGQ